MSDNSHDLEILKLRVLKSRPYFAPEVYAMQSVYRKDIPCLVSDDKFRLYWNEEVLQQFGKEEMIGVFLCNLYPLLLKHPSRAKQINARRELWPLASFLEVICILDDDGIRLPDGAVYPKAFKFQDGLLAEEYYRLLADMADKKGLGAVAKAAGVPVELLEAIRDGVGTAQDGKKYPFTNGSCVDGQPRKWDDPSPKNGGAPTIDESDAEHIRQQVAEEVRKHDKSQGKLPGALKRWADSRYDSKVDWRRETRAILRHAIETTRGLRDFSYFRLSRRSPAVGILLPSLVDRRLNVVVVVDTSGSMQEKEIAEALSEINAIVKSVATADGVFVICCDAAVHTAKKVFSADQVEPVGGGGTDMRVGISKAIKHAPRPDVIVVMSDGYTPWGDDPANVPVIACITSDGTMDSVPDWIQSVRIEDDGK